MAVGECSGRLLAMLCRPQSQHSALCHRPAASSSSSTRTGDEDFTRIEAVARESYFKLFQLDQRYDIDQQLLKQRFTRLQRLFHPDKFASDNQSSQEASGEISSLINSAFQALQDPHSRGVYLLRLQGQQVGDGDESGAELSPEFLNQMMKLNEDVEEAVREDQLIQMREENTMKQSHLQQQITSAFHQQDFDRCKSLLVQLKFYRSIEQSIKQKLP